jgi:hypothetical protein
MLSYPAVIGEVAITGQPLHLKHLRKKTLHLGSQKISTHNFTNREVWLTVGSQKGWWLVGKPIHPFGEHGWPTLIASLTKLIAMIASNIFWQIT